MTQKFFKQFATSSALLSLILSVSVFADGGSGNKQSPPQLSVPVANANFPIGPNDQVTPGALCDKADAYRYAEHIKYCNRQVDGSLKQDIIHFYDVQFGFKIEQMDRKEFKIDHLIPLCMGGANVRENLWPQHQTIYVKTDLIEETLCKLMEAGKMKQNEAVSIILDVKHHLEKADSTRDQLLRQL